MWLAMLIHLLMHYESRGLILLVLDMLLLILALLLTMLLVKIWIIKVFVSLFDSKKNFTAFISKLKPLLTEIVIIIHIFFGFLCILYLLVVYKGMRTILGMGFCLFHPDCPDFTIS